MDGLEEKLGQVLSDPQAMGQIMELAQSLGLQSSAPDTAQAPQSGGPDLSQMAGLLANLSSHAQDSSKELALLQALKPLVSPQRAAKLDRALEAARMARMAEVLLAQQQQKRQV